MSSKQHKSELRVISNSTPTAATTSPTRALRRRRDDHASKRAFFPSPPKSSSPRPGKRRKTCHPQPPAAVDYESDIEACPGSYFEPQFWDKLSRVPLTSSALRELDRRNQQAPVDVQSYAALPRGTDSDLARFARHGGPDLSDVRGFEDMTPTPPTGPSRATRGGKNARGGINKPRGQGKAVSRSQSGSKTKTKSTSPYDAAFRQHLIDYDVWPIGHWLPDGKPPPAPNNLQQLTRELRGKSEAGRASLEPEAFTEADFERLRKAYETASAEEARSRTLDAVEGALSLSSSHIKAGPFKSVRLAALTPDQLVPGNPDRAYGSRPESLQPSVRKALHDLILPTAKQDILCPNFIVHIKGPNGDAEVAKLQAVYDGALAARGMDALWSYGTSEGEDKDTGDPVARTITCTLVDGVLRMYAVHLYKHGHADEPESASPHIAYSTSRVGSWLLYDDDMEFRKGAAAFRNGLEWARGQREEAIARANRKANAVTQIG